jgi:arylsulfatase A-like enzyme
MMNRRTFLKSAATAGALCLGNQLLPTPWHTAAPQWALAADGAPNLLVIIVDQMRSPQWFPDQAALDTYLPNIARLRQGAVNLGNHYTVAAACTPARACMVTGLYTHQSWCMVTQSSVLNPGFPTWGTLLRNHGYQTNWFGKWHLSEETCPDLEVYGFNGQPCPDPHGSPGQGDARDPNIATQFATWMASPQANNGPWCTTVSFVNPHDIMWYPRFTEALNDQANPPKVFTELPANYETPAQLLARQKPRTQRALQQIAAQSFGAISFSGPNYEAAWLEMRDLYLLLQQHIDAQIGRVLDALEAKPAVAANTVILFTSDHGEYCGSHGLRGKGGSVYEESIHVPFYVKDLTGRFTANPEVTRTQLTASVDVAPLLLTLGTGGNSWRQQAQYAHLANRLDVAAILSNSTAAGRPYILHTTDEPGNEEDPSTPFTDNPPNHIIGYRTPTAKLGLYSYWETGTTTISATDQERELYDYSTTGGQQEIDNSAPAGGALYDQLYTALTTDAIPNELRQPLPDYLQAPQQAALNTYLAEFGGSRHLYLPTALKSE